SAFAELKPLLEGLTEKIPELESLELGLNFNDGDAAWDLVLRSVHRDRAALETYRNHPEHRAAAKRLVAMVKDSAVVDFST
ncbi:MAG: Dabb family protein, partial [Salinispira sp.]